MPGAVAHSSVKRRVDSFAVMSRVVKAGSMHPSGSGFGGAYKAGSASASSNARASVGVRRRRVGLEPR